MMTAGTYTTTEAAAALGIGANAVRKACQAGRLTAHRVGSAPWQVSRAAVLTYPARRIPHRKTPAQADRARVWRERRAQEALDAEPYLRAVCAVCRVSREELLGGGRAKTLISQRRVATYLLLRDAGLGLKAAARQLRQHHATTLHAERVLARGITTEQRYEIAECRRFVAEGTRRQKAVAS